MLIKWEGKGYWVILILIITCGISALLADAGLYTLHLNYDLFATTISLGDAMIFGTAFLGAGITLMLLTGYIYNKYSNSNHAFCIVPMPAWGVIFSIVGLILVGYAFASNWKYF